MLRWGNSWISRQFSIELTWRLYLVVQIIGLVALAYMDLSERYWCILPRHAITYWTWDIFTGRFWDFSRSYPAYNWISLALLFGPFLLAKAIDWVVAGKRTREPL